MSAQHRAPSFARDAIRVAQVHDLLNNVLDPDVPIPYPPFAPPETLLALRDFTCWLLGHDENTNMAELLGDVDKWARSFGLVMNDSQGEVAPPFPTVSDN